MPNQVRQELICCPACGGGMKESLTRDSWSCTRCDATYRSFRDRPLLIKGSNEVFKPEDYAEHENAPTVSSQRPWQAWLPTPSVNLSARRVLGRLREELDQSQRPCTILVVGGGTQRSWLDPLLNSKRTHQVIYSDIDVLADVDVFCDAHDLPFRDGSFDAVITTAVLEHVIQPSRVACEISRVVRIGGMLYSELPFMQQVHEGAYDFTRFTLGGHRRLFNQFKEIDAGMTAGPATALVWSIENFMLAFASRASTRKVLKVLSRLLFSPLKYLDFWLVRNQAAMDAASCTYFLGVRTEAVVTDEDIIARYVGAKHMKHV